MATKNTNNTIVRYTEMIIGEKHYKLQYTVKALILLEPRLSQKSILKELADAPFTYQATFEMLKWALFGGGNAMKDEEVEEVMMSYFDEHNLGELQELLVNALMVSGAIGKIDNGKN